MEAGTDHIHSHLIRLMIKGNVGKIDVEVDIVRIRHNSLAKDADCLRSIFIGFVGRRCQLEDISIRSVSFEQRLRGQPLPAGEYKHPMCSLGAAAGGPRCLLKAAEPSSVQMRADSGPRY